MAVVPAFVRYASKMALSGASWRRSYGQGKGRGSAAWKWFGIPTSLGVVCIALVKLQRMVLESREGEISKDSNTWQIAKITLFQQLPTRALSRTWGALVRLEIPIWLRRPVLGLYVRAFGCNMQEAEQPDLTAYATMAELFTRKLKPDARPVAKDCLLVSPVDGTVMHFGHVVSGTLEQVKGVTFSLEQFLGEGRKAAKIPSEDLNLHYVILYLSPGDYHHFHSPANWKAQVRRHIYGELLPVAQWAAHALPGLFAVNERVLVQGRWEHGLFSLVAVGAFNVGSITLEHDEDLVTNKKGVVGYMADKVLGSAHGGLSFRKGDHIGTFNLGSTVVLLFHAPNHFNFLVKPGQKMKYGQPLGNTQSQKQSNHQG